MKKDLIEQLTALKYSGSARVVGLIEKPGPGIHATRLSVDVEAGKGFTGDHPRKDIWRGKRIPGREITMFSAEVAEALSVDPVVIGDNIVSRGLDLSSIEAGDVLRVGEVVLRRSEKAHRPCDLFARRASQDAMEAVRETGTRGALFYVLMGGTICIDDNIKAE
jgi:MOSC domain-containing protein YiiM